MSKPPAKSRHHVHHCFIVAPRLIFQQHLHFREPLEATIDGEVTTLELQQHYHEAIVARRATIFEQNHHSCSLRRRRRRITQYGSHHTPVTRSVIHEPTVVMAEAAREEEGRNPNLGEKRSCHVSLFQWTLKYLNLVKDWSKKRGLTANINIFGCLYKFGLQD